MSWTVQVVYNSSELCWSSLLAIAGRMEVGDNRESIVCLTSKSRIDMVPSHKPVVKDFSPFYQEILGKPASGLSDGQIMTAT